MVRVNYNFFANVLSWYTKFGWNSRPFVISDSPADLSVPVRSSLPHVRRGQWLAEYDEWSTSVFRLPRHRFTL